jgi:hypothetical protein
MIVLYILLGLVILRTARFVRDPLGCLCYVSLILFVTMWITVRFFSPAAP